MNIDLQKLICKRCDYTWTPRKEDVRLCPKCKSPYWDRDRILNRDQTWIPNRNQTRIPNRD